MCNVNFWKAWSCCKPEFIKYMYSSILSHLCQPEFACKCIHISTIPLLSPLPSHTHAHTHTQSQMMQKLGKSDQTRDDVYDEFVTNFNKQQVTVA